MNPVILLDEVDKVGADWRGDPSAALLEVLDPAQNSTFRDHYLDVELDLSDVDLHRDGEPGGHDPRPAARPDGSDPVRRLHDRREGRDRERLPLAAPARAQRPARGRGHGDATRCSRRSSPSTRARRACASSSVSSARCCARPRRGIASETVEAPVAVDVDVVRDALGRQRFFREAAERTAVPGVATGLAVTGVGGDVLFVEATSIPGGEKLVLTGQLGDVMKESAQIALSAVRARASDYGLDDDIFENRSFHVHVPGGRDPEGRPERRHHDGDGACVAAHRPARQAHGRDDRRGDAAGPRAPDRRPQAEGARRPRGRAHRRRHPRAQPRRHRRRPAARP